MRTVTAVALCLCFAVALSKDDGTRKGERCVDSALQETCTLLVSVTDYDDDREESYRAECDIAGKLYIVDWSESYVRDLVKKEIIVSGNSQLDLVNVEIDDKRIRPSEDSKILPRMRVTHRELNDNTKSMLVVRVIAQDSSSTLSKETLGDKVFGVAGDQANLKSQYAACSYNQMNFTPAVYDGVINGVLEISIAQNATNKTASDIQEAVTDALGFSGKPYFADHVMYCLPPGTSGGWIAYAYLNNWLSVYNDKWCQSLSTQMHEVGHNLNLGHSNEKGVAYADQSGYMGYSYGQDDTPLMCFNAYNLWKLGWYKSKAVELQKGESFSGDLSGIVDYESEKTSTVLIRLNTETLYDYYMIYNRKAGFNSGTQEGANQVLVVVAEGDGRMYSQSDLVAKLNAGDSFIFNETLTGGRVTLLVNSIDVTANIDIMTNVTKIPTDVPTNEPKIPTDVPTNEPTTTTVPTTVPTTTVPTTTVPTTTVPTKKPTKSPSKVGPTNSPRIPPRNPKPQGIGMDRYKNKGMGRCRGCI